MSKGEVRPLPWLQARSRPALNCRFRRELVRLAAKMKPNDAKDEAQGLVFRETGNFETAAALAKACRWLAKVRTDHGTEAFWMTVNSGRKRGPRRKGTDRRERSAKVATGTGQRTKDKSEESGPGGKHRPTPGHKPKGKDDTPPGLPLEHIEFRPAVNGTHAQVRCIQHFRNTLTDPVEAVYCFPLPGDASVTACTMRIGRRQVQAELKRREEARAEHEAALAAGHHSTLLEQERPNIFTVSAGGIEPGEKVLVEIDYVQPITWQGGEARFRVPLVVAPRFIPGEPVSEGSQGGGWSPNTNLVPDASRITPRVSPEGVSYRADILVSFVPGFRCRLSCPSHPTIIPEQTIAKDQEVGLEARKLLPDIDFTLVYRSLSRVPEVATHFGEFDGESFLSASIIPPGTAVLTGTDTVILLDVSGSMMGAKLEGLKRITTTILARLLAQKVDHRVCVVAYSDTPRVVVPLTPLNEIILPRLEQQINGLQAGGGTRLGQALRMTYQQFLDAGRPGAIILVTDGQTEDPTQTQPGIPIVAAGIDTAVNYSLLQVLARETGGTAEAFLPGENFDRAATRLAGAVSGPVLRDIKIEGAAPEDVVGIADVFEGRPATICIRFAGKAGKVKVTGTDPKGQGRSWDVSTKGAKQSSFLAQVWAQNFLREHPEVQQQIQVSLRYGVICRHTAFVAVSEKKVPGKPPVRVEIPVMLPRTWDFEAVFGAQPGARVRRVGAIRESLVAGGPPLAFRDLPIAASVGPQGLIAEPVDSFVDDIELCEAVMGDPGGDLDIGDIDLGPGAPDVGPPPSLHLRFTLDAQDPVDRLIGILVALDQSRRAEAQRALANLNLSPRMVKSWTAEKRACAYYFALRLSTYGFQVKPDVLAALAALPDGSEAAKAWYNLALREEGRDFALIVPASCDGADFIAWKHGRAGHPTTEWALVP